MTKQTDLVNFVQVIEKFNTAVNSPFITMYRLLFISVTINMIYMGIVFSLPVIYVLTCLHLFLRIRISLLKCTSIIIIKSISTHYNILFNKIKSLNNLRKKVR